MYVQSVHSNSNWKKTEMLAMLPYSYDRYLPLRHPRKAYVSPARPYFPLAYTHSRKTSRNSGIDEAFWELEEQQKQDQLINIILALLHI